MVSNLCAKKLVHSAKVLYDVGDLTAFSLPPLEFFVLPPGYIVEVGTS